LTRVENWDNIIQILDEELPSIQKLDAIMNTIGISKDLYTIGVDTQTAKMTFKATKDIRDKYVLSRLAWDLGLLEEMAESL
jgi:glycerol-1-phosphate dehydrogenase [NAD(P)+]